MEETGTVDTETPAVEPVVVEAPAAITPEMQALIDERIQVGVQAGVYQAMTALQPAPQQTTVPLDPYSRAQADLEAQGVYDDSRITALAIKYAQQDTAATVAAEFEARFGPQLASLSQQQIVNKLSGGDAKAAEYLSKISRGVNMEAMSPDARREVEDLFVRASRDYAREHTTPNVVVNASPGPQSIYSTITTAEREQAREIERLIGMPLTDDEIIAARTSK